MNEDRSPELPFNDDRYCLCCGEKNPLGLKMKFRYKGDKLLSEAVIPKEFQGFADVVHGGILGTLLDEMMVNLYWLRGEKAVTAEYQVRLKEPCPVNRKVLFSAWQTDAKRNVHYTEAEARLEDGTVVAQASAKCIKIQ
ncbi:MAG TPA: PaaI family thioesterase [bacterium]|nr:PaaI family thioesterase [bacterium]